MCRSDRSQTAHPLSDLSQSVMLPGKNSPLACSATACFLRSNRVPRAPRTLVRAAERNRPRRGIVRELARAANRPMRATCHESHRDNRRAPRHRPDLPFARLARLRLFRPIGQREHQHRADRFEHAPWMPISLRHCLDNASAPHNRWPAIPGTWESRWRRWQRKCPTRQSPTRQCAAFRAAVRGRVQSSQFNVRSEEAFAFLTLNYELQTTNLAPTRLKTPQLSHPDR